MTANKASVYKHTLTSIPDKCVFILYLLPVHIANTEFSDICHVNAAERLQIFYSEWD